MNSEQITVFLQEHWNWVTLLSDIHRVATPGEGAVLLIGAIMNWNWLCDPTGTSRTLTAMAAAPGGKIFSGFLPAPWDRADCDEHHVLGAVRRTKDMSEKYPLPGSSAM